MSEVERQAYLDALQRHVCAVCLDRRDDGRCGLTGQNACALESRLPSIVEALSSAVSACPDERVQAVKDRVCTQCTDQNEKGLCSLRERAECALDAYLPLVVEAVQEVRGEGASEA